MLQKQQRLSQAGANIHCLNLQWHPLEPAGGEEDDRWHQLAAQGGANHDLEPRLHGDTHRPFTVALTTTCWWFTSSCFTAKWLWLFVLFILTGLFVSLLSHRQSWPSLPPHPQAWWDMAWSVLWKICSNQIFHYITFRSYLVELAFPELSAVSGHERQLSWRHVSLKAPVILSHNSLLMKSSVRQVKATEEVSWDLFCQTISWRSITICHADFNEFMWCSCGACS